MQFISFWTDHGYEALAKRLFTSLEAFGLEGRIAKAEARHSWREAVSQKPQFILQHLLALRRPVVWLDADCEVKRIPSLLFTTAYDFAAYNYRADPCNPLALPYTPEMATVCGGVLLFGYTAPAIELLLRWEQMQQQRPEISDDQALSEVLNTLRPPVQPLWLPRAYNRMAVYFPETDPVIDHDYCDGRHRQQEGT